MAQLNSASLALRLPRRHPTASQKTMVINDFYFNGGQRYPFPLGSLQLLGKSKAAMLKTVSGILPHWLADRIALHTVDWWAISEDLPDKENRVSVTADHTIQIFWKPRNLGAHKALLKAFLQTLM